MVITGCKKLIASNFCTQSHFGERWATSPNPLPRKPSSDADVYSSGHQSIHFLAIFKRIYLKLKILGPLMTFNLPNEGESLLARIIQSRRSVPGHLYQNFEKFVLARGPCNAKQLSFYPSTALLNTWAFKKVLSLDLAEFGQYLTHMDIRQDVELEIKYAATSEPRLT